MNERIKELISQAGIHFHKGGTLDAGPNGIAKFVLYSDMEKFAELIVRECIQLAEQYASGGAGSEFDMGYCSCANTLSDEFKKRFGVE